MKIRTGFVSNSSSSSFIIGIGIVRDYEKLTEEINKLKFSKYSPEVEIKSIGDIRENPGYSYNIRGDKIEVESFTYDTVSVNTETLPSFIKIISFELRGNHDDSDFWNGSEYDYDIDLEFPEEYEKLVEIMHNEELVEQGKTTRGAGRDG